MNKIYLVMEYVQHDFKALMELKKSKNQYFTLGNIFIFIFPVFRTFFKEWTI